MKTRLQVSNSSGMMVKESCEFYDFFLISVMALEKKTPTHSNSYLNAFLYLLPQ